MKFATFEMLFRNIIQKKTEITEAHLCVRKTGKKKKKDNQQFFLIQSSLKRLTSCKSIQKET